MKTGSRRHAASSIAFGSLGAIFAMCAFNACVGDDPGSGTEGGDANAPGADAAAVDTSSPEAAPVDAGTDACAACGDKTCFEGVCGGNAIVQVSAGSNVTCALTASGSVYCWGQTDEKELGNAVAASSCTDFGATVACQPTPTKIAGLDHVSKISNSNSACALRKTDGAVLCWGANGAGQLGHEAGTKGDTVCGTVACNATPTVVDGLTDAVDVQVGSGFACAITSAKKVKCWGRNDFGNLGQGTVGVPGSSASPLQLQALSNVTSLALNGNNACALVGTNGSVWCWGDNVTGSLGHTKATKGDDGSNVNGTPTTTFTSDQTTVLAGVSSMSTGVGTCFVTNGLVACNGTGFLTVNADPGVYTAVPTAVAGITGATAVTGRFHACALVANGNVTCWGTNENGALGRGTIDTTTNGFTQTNAAAQVPGITATQLASSPNFMVALTADGKVLTWGKNTSGVLGHVAGTNGDVTCYGGGNTVAGTMGHCNATPGLVQGLP